MKKFKNSGLLPATAAFSLEVISFVYACKTEILIHSCVYITVF